MEQQKEKKREKHRIRRRRRRSKPTSSFPMDLTSEILLRLPLKSLTRFRCVSKLWSSFITDPYFINLFDTRSSRPRLLFCFRKDDNMFVASIPQHSKISNKPYSFSQPTDRYQMKLPEYGCYQFTESVHGLICFLGSDDTPIVWNHSKQQLLTLPKPKPFTMSLSDDISIFLGYEPIEGKHKLVCVPEGVGSDVYQVLTLGSAQESWRMVKTNRTHPYYTNDSDGRCIKGVIYYHANILKTGVSVMMSFDVKTELFDVIQLPSDIDRGVKMLTYEGKLACVKKKGYSYDTVTLCILEDAEKHQWSRKDFLAPSSHFDQSLAIPFKLKGITHAGEFIYAPYMCRKSSYILFCDPVRNSYRRFEFKGIGEDDYWPWLYLFLNHIESQSISQRAGNDIALVNKTSGLADRKSPTEWRPKSATQPSQEYVQRLRQLRLSLSTTSLRCSNP